jgi:hypothetical protein
MDFNNRICQSLLNHVVPPAIVQESESSFEVPFSKEISEGFYKNAADIVTLTLENKLALFIQAPRPFVGIVVKRDSPIGFKSEIS